MDLNIKVSSDSRTIKPGEYFIPFKGENFDGSKFIKDALDKGAAGILQPEELYELARKKLEQYKVKVIGITGSVGKTTTKEALATVLSGKYSVFSSPGNRNTLLGLSADIVNNLKKDHEISVSEIAMDKPGEIAETCTYIKPDIGIITNISGVHKEKLKTIANIIKAKGELLEFMDKDSVAFLNKDDKNVRKLEKTGKCKKIWFSTNTKHGYKTNLAGSHVDFVVTLIDEVCSHMGMSEKEIQKGLLKVRNSPGRMSKLEGKKGSIVLDDTYNASPASVKAGINYLRSFNDKKKICILGDMLELGTGEIQAHESIIKYALKHSDKVILVGKKMRKAAKKIVNGATLNILDKSSDFDLNKHLDSDFLSKNAVFLVKGSRGIQMENVVKKLLKNSKRDSEFLVG
ncbi:UDP-N-acetylmuramoyl-tripeptide--D-alanyl-D-alanine ligase [Patescibacteria group bacterium]|nr:UDP-N-acetylmuramoyl-tripeptide--D-alanyl-D-alanine ligase [Patescibacteria group bacterium]